VERVLQSEGNVMGENEKKTDKQILKSTFIMGGSSVINSLLGIARTKVIALLLGPSGMGLTGIYITITNLVSTFSGMGIGESGVRQIAGALGSTNPEIVSKTIRTVRKMALLTGGVGLAAMFLLRTHISNITFGNSGHSYDVALLSFTIFFGAVSAGQTALIQGMRRIGDLAKVSIFGAVLGTAVSIPVVYIMGERGIAAYLIMVSAMSFLASWWYSSRIDVVVAEMSWRESFAEARPLLKLGLALMLGSLMAAGTQYLLRVIVVRSLGLSAAGAYHASTTLALVYVGIILNAMLTDFYPRLSSVADDHPLCRSLINKQIEIGVLLAVPGILAIMTFAPFVIVIFYSAKFVLAVDILRWQILGVLLQVVSWPMGFMLRAKGDGKLFLLTELFANIMHLSLAWIGITHFGLTGIGIAFFIMNILYWLAIFMVITFKYGFSFESKVTQLLVAFTLGTAVVFLTPYFLPKMFYLLTNGLVTVSIGLFSLWQLCDKGSSEMIPGLFLKIKARFGNLGQ
jgi:enterobacterial common antigen flippase